MIQYFTTSALLYIYTKAANCKRNDSQWTHIRYHYAEAAVAAAEASASAFSFAASSSYPSSFISFRP